MSQMQREVEARAHALGLRFPPVRYRIKSDQDMRDLAVRKLPGRYLYPWLCDEAARTTHAPLEVMVLGAVTTAYVHESLFDDSARLESVMGHVCGHADMFHNSPLFAHAPRDGDKIGYRNAAVTARIVADVGAPQVDHFLDRWLMGEVQPANDWQATLANYVTAERARLAPIAATAFVGEAWAIWWQVQIAGDACLGWVPPHYVQAYHLAARAEREGRLWDLRSMCDADFLT